MMSFLENTNPIRQVRGSRFCRQYLDPASARGFFGLCLRSIQVSCLLLGYRKFAEGGMLFVSVVACWQVTGSEERDRKEEEKMSVLTDFHQD